jgi:hypothetical protein
MFNAMQELMRLHPASHYGRRGHRPSAVEAFEVLESRHLDSMRLERAAYLLVVGIDRLVGAIAALGWRIVLFLARRSVTAERRSVRADETRA